MTDDAGVPAPLIYLDFQATTPVDPRVIEAMHDALRQLVGNPNSVQHGAGRAAAHALERARAQVAALAGVDPDEIRFTTGATDAIRLAFDLALGESSVRRVAVMPVEHPSLLRAIARHEAAGRIERLPLEVDAHGQLRPESLVAALAEGADLICLMAANNEVGTIYPLGNAVRQCRAAGAKLLVDATQAAGRTPLDEIGAEIDYLIFSAHKMYGPKGAGALACRHRADTSVEPAGTPNVPAIVGFGRAAQLALAERDADARHTAILRDYLEEGLVAAIPGLVVNGDRAARLAHSLHVSIPGAPNDAVLARVGHRLAISTGSACMSGALEPSSVLRAMQLPEPLIEGALRLSTGRYTTRAEVKAAVALIADAAAAIRGQTGSKGRTNFEPTKLPLLRA